MQGETSPAPAPAATQTSAEEAGAPESSKAAKKRDAEAAAPAETTAASAPASGDDDAAGPSPAGAPAAEGGSTAGDDKTTVRSLMHECIHRSCQLRQMSKWVDFGFLCMQEEEGGGDAPAAAAAGDSSEAAAKVREACMMRHCSRMTWTHFACSHALTGKSESGAGRLHATNISMHRGAMASTRSASFRLAFA